MNARRTTEAVITSAETQWAPLSAAVKKATNYSLMSGHAKVSGSQMPVMQWDFCMSPYKNRFEFAPATGTNHDVKFNTDF